MAVVNLFEGLSFAITLSEGAGLVVSCTWMGLVAGTVTGPVVMLLARSAGVAAGGGQDEPVESEE